MGSIVLLNGRIFDIISVLVVDGREDRVDIALVAHIMLIQRLCRVVVLRLAQLVYLVDHV